MKELKDIVLKKGDLIYSNSEIVAVSDLSNNLRASNTIYDGIIKIERPIKYETIYEVPREILTKEEKEYLEAVIRPFKKEWRTFISKKQWNVCKECIYIKLRLWSNPIILPCFDSGKMYKGMELDKEYTLKELGLFKESMK